LIEPVAPLEVSVERLGLVMSPDGDPLESEGTLNPASARTRSGELMLYPRDVAKGNISRVGRAYVKQKGDTFEVSRDGFALEPEAAYELRPTPGYGCEDPRVTFVPVLDAYVMCYTAYGPLGPRIALALSRDALTWERVGLLRFDQPGMADGEDKDAAFFPEPVISPGGVRSLAFYHRPMLHVSAVDGRAAVPMIQRLLHEDRESIRIGYIPLDVALSGPDGLCDVRESVIVLSPNEDWGSIKVGAGTPPVRIDEGWLSVFHGVDLIDNSGAKPKFRYSAGVVIHDYRRPDRVIYRSPQPVLTPETEYERRGVVDNVVFPTGIDERPDLGERIFDLYYGMADYAIGAARMTLR
jgi:beta-1,2-mannobiose phosphorylase / 1,2-beta-oligomannan phosphorylase